MVHMSDNIQVGVDTSDTGAGSETKGAFYALKILWLKRCMEYDVAVDLKNEVTQLWVKWMGVASYQPR